MAELVAALLAAAVLLGAPRDQDLLRIALIAPRRHGSRGRARSLRWRSGDATVGPNAALALVDSIIPALEAGLSPAAALAHATEGLVTPGHRPFDPLAQWVHEARAAAGTGEPVSAVLVRGAQVLRSGELELLAAAWSLTETTGGPLADAVRTTGGLIRGARTQRRRLAAAVAGARATMNLLTVLPLGGPLVALALGVDPATVYLGSPVAVACLVIGVLLALVGRAWVRRLVARAVSGPVVA